MKDHGSKKESQKKGCKARVKKIGEETCPRRCKEDREEKTGEEGRKENGKESGEKNRKEVREKSRCRVPGPSADAGCRIKAEGHAQEVAAQETK
jgi:hypothetical protein